MKKAKISDLPVFVVRCGCGHVTTALDQERSKAAMLDHLMFAHREGE